MGSRPLLNTKSLKEQVYDYLRLQMQKGKIIPGSVLDLREICIRLGISKTPLREALLLLEREGFVTIKPRRGVVVNVLSRQEIKDIYEVIGALEASALKAAFKSLKDSQLKKMEQLVLQMHRAIRADDFNSYYEKNLQFHNVYLELGGNAKLVKMVNILKKRLYDFPRQSKFVKEWEVASIAEHRKLVRLIRAEKKREAMRFIQDVHWSFAVQEKFVRLYYPAASREREVANSRKPMSRRRHGRGEG